MERGVARSARAILATILIGLLAAACGSQQRTFSEIGTPGHYRAGRPMYKVGAPYQIDGVWYYPAVDYDYDGTGVASWYGEAFDQQYTANGEIFDLNQLTAAHRTGRIFVQAGAFSVQENAQRLQLRISPLGSVQVLTASVNGSQMYRVRLGPLLTVEQADRALARIVAGGHPEARIVVD
jgi:SPOR domain